MPNDDINHIPSIVPAHDRDPVPGAGKSRGAASNRKGGKGSGSSRPPSSSGGGGLLGRLLITVALVVAGVACAWAWQLQGQLEQASVQMGDYASRIADLEDRLSDTDEGMSQNATVQAAKIRELDTEVRKLWDNVWKQTKSRLVKLESDSKKQATALTSAQKSIASTTGKIKSAEGDLAKLKSVSGDLQRLMTSAKANQAEVERVADTLNRINLDMAKLNRQVKDNTDAQRSTDSFRREVNTSINQLQGAIRALQAAP